MLSNQAEELLLQRVGAAQARQNGGSGNSGVQSPGGGHGPIDQGYTENVSYDSQPNMQEEKAFSDISQSESTSELSQVEENSAESQRAVIVWPKKPHKNGTKGHWETIQRTAEILASGQRYAVLFVNQGLSNVIPGVRPNRRPDIIAIRRDGKVDQFEIPSKTDLDWKLEKRMEDNKQILGDLAGNT